MTWKVIVELERPSKYFEGGVRPYHIGIIIDCVKSTACPKSEVQHYKTADEVKLLIASLQTALDIIERFEQVDKSMDKPEPGFSYSKGIDTGFHRVRGGTEPAPAPAPAAAGDVGFYRPGYIRVFHDVAQIAHCRKEFTNTIVCEVGVGCEGCKYLEWKKVDTPKPAPAAPGAKSPKLVPPKEPEKEPSEQDCAGYLVACGWVQKSQTKVWLETIIQMAAIRLENDFGGTPKDLLCDGGVVEADSTDQILLCNTCHDITTARSVLNDPVECNLSSMTDHRCVFGPWMPSGPLTAIAAETPEQPDAPADAVTDTSTGTCPCHRAGGPDNNDPEECTAFDIAENRCVLQPLPPPVPCHVCGLVVESLVVHEGHIHCEMCYHRVTNFQLVFTGTVGFIGIDTDARIGSPDYVDIIDTQLAAYGTLVDLFEKFFFGEGAKVLIAAKGGNIRIDMLELPPPEA